MKKMFLLMVLALASESWSSKTEETPSHESKKAKEHKELAEKAKSQVEKDFHETIAFHYDQAAQDMKQEPEVSVKKP